MITGTAILTFMLLSQPAVLQGEDNVSAAAKLSKDGLHAGSDVRGALVVTVRKGWHVNSATPSDENLIATSAAFTPPAGLAVAGVRYPRGTSRKFSFSEGPMDVYEGTVVIKFNITAAGEARPGDYAIPVDVSYQACNDDICLAPASVHLVIPVRVLESDVRPAPANPEIFGGAPQR
jgi:DsbC/DsbD-like thiol-disulfide interchange protein